MSAIAKIRHSDEAIRAVLLADRGNIEAVAASVGVSLGVAYGMRALKTRRYVRIAREMGLLPDRPETRQAIPERDAAAYVVNGRR
jgi:hypothetical protein